MSDSISKIKKSRAIAEGCHEWAAERIYGLFSIPLMAWLVVSLIMLARGDYSNLGNFLSYAHNVVLLILFLGFFTYYTSLAMKVVFEDYIHIEWIKWCAILKLRLFGILFFTGGTLAILKIFLKG